MSPEQFEAWKADLADRSERHMRAQANGLWSQGYPDIAIAKALGTTPERVIQLIFGRGRTA